jgi:thiol-disulfide isomerase/thioredoxin
MSSSVVLHLYDLSQGMAKNLSRQFLGKQIDGIWHTGIVVYGKEFYYGGGICKDPPSKTPYGTPMKSITLGETEIPEDLFLEFLTEINYKFTSDKYDLFENNCNNFTDACSEFLVGEKIPTYITGLPKEVLATPMGKMIRPMMDNMQRSVTQNSHPMFEQGNSQQQSFGGQQANNNNGFGGFDPNLLAGFNPNNFGGQNTNTTANTSTSSGPAVKNIVDPTELTKLIQSSPAVIIDFFSYTCPPCMKIKPYYESLAKTYAARCPELKFVSVDTQAARMIAMNHQIQSIPTFVAYYEGVQFQRFSGADAKRVESLAFTLEGKINSKSGKFANNGTSEPSGPSFKLLNPTKKDFYTFSGSNYALPIKNINTVLEANALLTLDTPRATFDKFAENPQDNVKSFTQEEKTALVNWIFETITALTISDKTIGFIDLLRMLSLDATYLEIILKSQDKIQNFLKFLEKSDQELRDLPKGLKLVLLRFITNLTASEKSKPVFQDSLSSFVELLTKVGTAYKDDKPSLYPVIMTLWNLVQNFSKTKELAAASGTIAHFVRLIFNDTTDNEVLLGTALILSLFSFVSLEFRKELNSKIDKAKLAKLEFSEDPNVGKITRDLSDILEGTA